MVIQRSMARTGNEEPVSRPSYYGDMVTAYAGLHGLGDIEFGLECTPLTEGVDEIVRDLEAEDERDNEVDAISAVSRTNKRNPEVDSEVSRQRQGRKNAPADISFGLEKFGITLGAAIIQAPTSEVSQPEAHRTSGCRRLEEGVRQRRKRRG
ncbi:hypothetical protein AaE_015555 [Aphanomyces astaci]|uniref:Uncharacterized protein n=1 Tax=Aphanomyces astaci TaxID=112090 RepID=A0A6A4Z104_APHAT|nr:hypothetical protein AaE_015555 [Aphanomyces astaci]